MSRLALILLSLALISGLFLGCARSSPKVAMILGAGGLENSDFNKGNLLGAEKAAKELGIKLDYVLPQASMEFESLQRQYATGGEYKLIICVGSTQTEALARVADSFPRQRFALIDSSLEGKPNVASYLFRDAESSFLAGALAAMVTRTNQIGFTGGMDIPVIQGFLGGYQAGAKYINPRCQVLVSYVDSWSDPAKAKALAFIQYDQGADVIFGVAGGSSLGVIEAAKERGQYAIGVDGDQRYLAPDNVLVSVLKNVEVAAYSAIRQNFQGNFSQGTHSLGLKENGIGLSLDNSLPLVTEEMKDKILEISKKIITGEIEVSFLLPTRSE